MRIVAVFVMIATPAVVGAQSLVRPLELRLNGGFTDGPGYESKAPGTSLTGSVGTSWFRANGGISYSWLHKQGTPGGFQRSFSYSAEAGHPRLFVLAGVSQNYVDQTSYIKEVTYRYGGLGTRWTMGWRNERPLNYSEVRLVYYREHESTYRNRTNIYAVRYTYERQLSGRLYLGLGIRLGAVYFDDNPYPGAQRRHGMSSNFDIGLALKP